MFSIGTFLVGMVAKSSRKYIIYGVIAAISVAIVGGIGYKIYSLQSELTQYKIDRVKTLKAIEDQQTTIRLLDFDIRRMTEINTEFEKDLREKTLTINQIRRAQRVSTKSVDSIDRTDKVKIEQAERLITDQYNQLLKCFAGGGRDAECNKDISSGVSN